nr:hypothetical protein Q903MT_gene416 [Picea sitchensis]
MTSIFFLNLDWNYHLIELRIMRTILSFSILGMGPRSQIRFLGYFGHDVISNHLNMRRS